MEPLVAFDRLLVAELDRPHLLATFHPFDCCYCCLPCFLSFVSAAAASTIICLCLTYIIQIMLLMLLATLKRQKFSPLNRLFAFCWFTDVDLFYLFRVDFCCWCERVRYQISG